MANPPQEIERQWIVRELPPDLERHPRAELEQGYLAVDADGNEVRLRHKDDRYLITVKSGGDLVRTEREVEITALQFEGLWAATEGRRIHKDRYRVPHGDHVIEVDVYHGALEGLVSAEVEFASLEDSESFDPPPWCGREVTSVDAYKNKNLARFGLPPGTPGNAG